MRPVLASGAQGKFTTSLGVGPDAAWCDWCQRLVLNPKHHTVPTAKDLIGRTHKASGAPLGTLTSSKRDRSKTKIVPLDLRTISELPSARFTKCAPHLNLKALPKSSY